MAIVNVAESTIAREGVLSCKPLQAGNWRCLNQGFYDAACGLACLAIHAAKARRQLDANQEAALVRHLQEVPARMQREMLRKEGEVANMARAIMNARDVLFLGRGSLFRLLWKALKLKEISYIHAEGYAAGEMKHGPIALIDEAVPVIVCAPDGPLFEKTMGNIQEVAARGNRSLFIL